jgi:hypothetical protein
MDVWSASGAYLSFVITFASPIDPDLDTAGDLA